MADEVVVTGEATTTEGTATTDTSTELTADSTATPEAPNGTVLGDGGTPPASEGGDWLSALPEELRGNERLSGLKSVAELAEAYSKANIAPAPLEADAYKLPENFPIKDIGVWANKLGLTQAQLDNVLALDAHARGAEYEFVEKTQTEGLNKLFETWGAEKDANIQYAKQFINHFDEGGQLKQLLNTTRAGNNPTVVAFMAKVGRELMKEDGFIPNKGPTSRAAKSAAEVIFDKS